MTFANLSDQELKELRQVWLAKADTIQTMKSDFKVNGPGDTVGIEKSVRLNKVKRQYFQWAEKCKTILRQRKMAAKNEGKNLSKLAKAHKPVIIHTRISKRTRKILNKLHSTGAWRKKYDKLRDPNISPTLPLTIIGNATLREMPFDLELYADHRRLRVFLLKGNECIHPECNKTATRIIESMDVNGGTHYDLFTNTLQHMNVDHIMPRSQGGTDDLENLQPMCAKHNSLKSNKLVPY